MKKYLPLLLLLSSCAIFRIDPISQPAGPYKKKGQGVIRKALPMFENSKIDIIAGPGKYEIPCVYYVPEGYDKNKAYPLVIFFHGTGEAGNDVNKLYNTGLPQVLKAGYKPSFDFIMIAPQHSSYSPEPRYLVAILEEAKKKFLIDSSRIYLTGLSAGGYPTYGSQFNIDMELAQKFAAIVPISAATQDVNKFNLDWIRISKTPVWAIVGNDDVSYRDQNVFMVNQINSRVSGLATITIRPNVGHGGWNDVYNGSILNNGKNVWQWLYQFQRGFIAPIPPPDPIPQYGFKVGDIISIPILKLDTVIKLSIQRLDTILIIKRINVP